MATLTFNSSITDGGNATPNLSPQATAGNESVYNHAIPASSTNFAVAATFVVAKVKGTYLYCTADCTLKTNSSGSPAQTLTFKANTPLIWQGANDPRDNPWTTDVTGFFVTCVAGGQLIGTVLIDPS